jgi:SecD/SecF fusion protein
LLMLRLIHKPNVNWMGARPIFFSFSILLIVVGLFVFFTRDDEKNNKYDIEFTGGTCVQINLKEGVSLTRQQVEDRIRKVGADLNNPALAAANVYSIGKSDKQYEIITTETNRTTAIVTFGEDRKNTVETVTSAIRSAEAKSRGRLSNLQVTQSDEQGCEFVISTSQVNTSLVRNIVRSAFADAEISQPQVDEVVNNAVLTAFGDELEIQQNLGPRIVSQEKITEEYIEAYPELTDFLGGIKLVCEIDRAATSEKIGQRFRDLRFKPAQRDLSRYPYQILGSDLAVMEPNSEVNSFVYVSVEPEAGLRQLSEDEWSRFVANETGKVLAAAELETSLPRVTQTDPSIGAQAKNRAAIAIVLSLIAIVGYIWIRFGDARYGFAAIAALTHDVLITLGAVTACTYIAATPLGESLLIGDFKINLAMIAAFLTLIGYSLNDTIVVFDRIRENRHKKRITAQIITDSINQTLSRTILTSFTTFIVVLTMYIFGGQGLRGFTFAIGFGIIIGSYSSIAIAAPILLFSAAAAKKEQGSKQQ